MNNEQPTLLLLTTDFKPMTGGVAEYLHNLWHQTALQRPAAVFSTVQEDYSGISRCAYRFEKLPALPQRLLGEHLSDKFSPLRKINTANYFRALDRYGYELAKQIKKDNPSKVEVFIGHWNVNTHFWCKALRKAGIAYSLFAHGMELTLPYYGNLPKWREEDFSAAKSIVANSRGTFNLIVKDGVTDVDIHIVNPGVEASLYSDQDISSKVSYFRNSVGIFASDFPIVLTVGRLVPRKGFDLVLDSIPELLRKFPKLQYVVAGSGEYGGQLKQKVQRLNIEDSVHFMGKIDDITKIALYKLCDVFVMPNRLLDGTDWEGFGIVFLEAALASKPCIGGNNGGVPDAIEQGKTGLLVDTEDHKATYDAIYSLLSNRELCLKLGKHAEQRARDSFSWEEQVKVFLNAISSNNLQQILKI